MNNAHGLKSASAPPAKPWLNPKTTIIRMPELEAITGLSRASVYKRMKDDPTFPRSVRLSDSKSRGAPVGWVLAEAQAWITAQIAKRDQELAV